MENERVNNEVTKEIEILNRFGTAMGYKSWFQSGTDTDKLLRNIRSSLYEWSLWPRTDKGLLPLRSVMVYVYNAIQDGKSPRPYPNQAQFILGVKNALTPDLRRQIMEDWYKKNPEDRPKPVLTKSIVDRGKKGTSFAQAAIVLHGIYGGEENMKLYHPKVYEQYMKFCELAQGEIGKEGPEPP